MYRQAKIKVKTLSNVCDCKGFARIETLSASLQMNKSSTLVIVLLVKDLSISLNLPNILENLFSFKADTRCQQLLPWAQ